MQWLYGCGLSSYTENLKCRVDCAPRQFPNCSLLFITEHEVNSLAVACLEHISFALKMEALSFSETSTNLYCSPRRQVA
jgi:hypothetical protein